MNRRFWFLACYIAIPRLHYIVFILQYIRKLPYSVKRKHIVHSLVVRLVEMVTSFIANAKPKYKKSGPHGRAHSSIIKALQKSSYLKSRKAIGRRIGAKRKRQQRDLHVVHRTGPNLIGKFLR